MNNQRMIPAKIYWSLYHEHKRLKNQIHSSKNKRCLFIKRKGKQCRQKGLLNQSGGEIINGYCKYHRFRN